MSPKRKKQSEPVTPAWTLPQIEEDAVRDGYEILFGPQRVKLVRIVVEYAPHPAAGPGRINAAWVFQPRISTAYWPSCRRQASSRSMQPGAARPFGWWWRKQRKRDCIRCAGRHIPPTAQISYEFTGRQHETGTLRGARCCTISLLETAQTSPVRFDCRG